MLFKLKLKNLYFKMFFTVTTLCKSILKYEIYFLPLTDDIENPTKYKINGTDLKKDQLP